VALGRVQITVDCAEPAALARFWAAVLGYPPPDVEGTHAVLKALGQREDTLGNWYRIEDPAGVGPRLAFQRVPEPKVVKNRVHLDLNVGGPRTAPPQERRRRIDAEVDRLVGLKARKVKTVEERGEYFVNMLDPEGNEFDVQ